MKLPLHWAAAAWVLGLAACGGTDAPVAPAPVALAKPHAAAPACTCPLPPAAAGGHYQTKTPYAPQQDPATYEAPPAGYHDIYTQVVARHGSRGLSSLKYDLAIYNLWRQAAADHALTRLGARLGPDVLRLMRANFLLGYGVAGISTPGYGNETQTGIDEHTQLAQRLLARHADLFTAVAAGAATQPRRIELITSGVDRAVDSGAFFVQSLVAARPGLGGLVERPPAPGPTPQPDGTDRFLLYFHKLVPALDGISDATDPLWPTYQASQAFQKWLKDADLAAKQAAILADPAAQAAGRVVLERLFTRAFVDKIANGTYRFANTGTFSFTSDDGRFTNTLTGDGETAIGSPAEAASRLYELYVIAPAMRSEACVDFAPYMPAAQAAYFAATQDAADFYKMGPGITEKGDVTWRMAQHLEDDLFNQVDAIERGDLGHVARLRFAHAEIMIPLASELDLKGVRVQVPLANTYSHASNPWRGETVSPMAANLQWDVVRNASGELLVKMLYNEKETDFKAACDGARFAPGSHYYAYAQLKACHGHVPAP